MGAVLAGMDASARWGLLLMALATSACAAMRRTWEFQPAVLGNAFIEPEVQAAEVSRDAVVVELSLVNRSAAPVALELGPTLLTLPDGTAIEGNSDPIEWGKAGAISLLEGLGVGSRDSSEVRPGDSRRFELVFRHTRRDLRRFAWMTVDLSRVSLNGSAAGLPALILRAPPEAPLGEDI